MQKKYIKEIKRRSNKHVVDFQGYLKGDGHSQFIKSTGFSFNDSGKTYLFEHKLEISLDKYQEIWL